MTASDHCICDIAGNATVESNVNTTSGMEIVSSGWTDIYEYLIHNRILCALILHLFIYLQRSSMQTKKHRLKIKYNI